MPRRTRTFFFTSRGRAVSQQMKLLQVLCQKSQCHLPIQDMFCGNESSKIFVAEPISPKDSQYAPSSTSRSRRGCQVARCPQQRKVTQSLAVRIVVEIRIQRNMCMFFQKGHAQRQCAKNIDQQHWLPAKVIRPFLQPKKVKKCMHRLISSCCTDIVQPCLHKGYSSVSSPGTGVFHM